MALSASKWTTGRIGNGLSFDGINDLVGVPDAETLDFTSAVTVSAWINLAEPIVADAFVLAKESLTGPSSYYVLFNNLGWLKFAIWTPGGYQVGQITESLPAGEWMRVEPIPQDSRWICSGFVPTGPLMCFLSIAIRHSSTRPSS